MPIPAFRAFSIQAAIVCGFNALAMLSIFPALLGLDLRLRRRGSTKVDLLCCYKDKKKAKVINQEASNGTSHDAAQEEDCNPFADLLIRHWCQCIRQTPFKVFTLLLAFALTCFGLYGVTHIQQGLNMEEVVPHNTSAYEFIKAQNSYFGFYHMYAVTQGDPKENPFEYPSNQKILYDYHNAFVRVPNIIKDDDGGLTDFWLPLFRNWLVWKIAIINSQSSKMLFVGKFLMYISQSD